MVSNKILKLVYNLEKNWEEEKVSPDLLIEEFLDSFDKVTGRVPGTQYAIEREPNPYPYWS